jgi:hypothetical protein
MTVTLLSLLGTLTQEAAADSSSFQRRKWKSDKAHLKPIYSKSIESLGEKLRCVSLDTVKPRRRRSVSDSPKVVHEMALGPPPFQHVQTFVVKQQKMLRSNLQPTSGASAFLHELFGEFSHGCLHAHCIYKVFASGAARAGHDVLKSETFIC